MKAYAIIGILDSNCECSRYNVAVSLHKGDAEEHCRKLNNWLKNLEYPTRNMDWEKIDELEEKYWNIKHPYDDKFAYSSLGNKYVVEELELIA